MCPLRGQGLIRALTTGVRAAGKPDASSWGPVAVSILISSVTFKLSGSSRDGGWSREASPGLLGKNFLGQGPGPGRRAAGNGSVPRGTGNLGAPGGARQAPGAAQRELPACAREGVRPAALRRVSGKRKPPPSPECQGIMLNAAMLEHKTIRYCEFEGRRDGQHALASGDKERPSVKVEVENEPGQEAGRVSGGQISHEPHET